MPPSSLIASIPAASRLTQRASYGSRGAETTPIAIAPLRRGRVIRVVTTRAFLGFGKSKEEKAIEEFASSDLGQRALAHAAKGGGLASMLEFGKAELEASHVPSDSTLIDAKTRVLCATLINKVVDIPILNEETEQIIALKAVDVIANYMEEELKRAGIAQFFDGVRDMSEKDVDDWVKGVTTKVNKEIDLPMLDEAQEEIVIEMFVKLIAHKFVQGNKKKEKKGWFGR